MIQAVQPFRICFMLFFVVYSLFSCQKKDTPEPSPTVLTMEAEGGSETVKLDGDGWKIAEIVSNKGGQRIFGAIYAADGKKIGENTVLTLDQPGRLEAGLGSDRQFSIEFENGEVGVTLGENTSHEVFAFTIVLTKGDKRKEITVEQNLSQGYTFHAIAYFLQEGDGDSLYTLKGTQFEFNLVSPQEILINPFGGVEIFRTASFHSRDRGAFSWITEDSVTVRVPVDVSEEGVILSDPIDVYGAVTKNAFAPEVRIPVEVPAGGARFSIQQEWRRRRVTYKLTLKNNRTGDLKEIAGKWIEQTPTGNYEIIALNP